MVNRSVTWADWDEDALALELQYLKDVDSDLSLTGFEEVELARLLNAQEATEGSYRRRRRTRATGNSNVAYRRPLASRQPQSLGRRFDGPDARNDANGRRYCGPNLHGPALQRRL